MAMFFVGRIRPRAAANANHTEGFKHKNEFQIPPPILQHSSKAHQKFGGCAEPYPPYALSHLKREALNKRLIATPPSSTLSY